MKQFFFISFLILGYLASSQDRFYFEQLSLNTSSEDEKIWDFCLDKKGILWIAGENGLYKYTGNKVTQYHNEQTNNNSLSFNKIKRIYVDSKNTLWIGSTQGLNIYDEKTNTFKNYLNDRNGVVAHMTGNIMDIVEDPRNKCYWILDFTEGLHQYIPRENRIIQHKLNHYESPIFTKLILDNDNIYIGSSVGLIQYSIPNKKIIFAIQGIPKINCMMKYRNSIFIGHTEGLVRYNITRGSYETIDLKEPIAYVTAIVNKDEKILISCDGLGLKLINPVTYEIRCFTKQDDSQLNSNNITSLYYDKNKILWAGSYMHGVNYSSSFTNYFVNISNGLNKVPNNEPPIIKAITYDDKKRLWIATDRGGLYFKHNDSYNLYKPKHPNDLDFAKLAITDIKWIGHKLHICTFGQGIYIYDTTTHVVQKINTKNSILKTNNIKTILKANNGDYWIGTFEFGIYMIDKNGISHHFNPKKHKYGSNYVYKIVEDKYKNLWFATEKGLASYNRNSGSFDVYIYQGVKNSKSLNSINDLLYVENRAEIYLGTYGNGLLKFDIHSKKITLVRNPDIQTLSIVTSLVEDYNGYIWIGAKNGICKYNPNTDKVETIINESKGVTINSITPNTGIITDKNKILFGSNKGLIQINPPLEEKNLKSPPLIIEKITSFKKSRTKNNIDTLVPREIIVDSIIKLEYNESDLEISFAGLNFINPKGNKYKYKLHGIESAWRTTSTELTARYYNIPPGEYEFTVHAANNYDIWNVTGRSIKIMVMPPWWRTWWFYSLMFMLFSGIILFIYYLRVRTIKRYNKLLEKEITNKTSELSESNANLKILLYKTSHDVKGPLKSLSTLAQLALGEVKEKASQTYLSHIANASRKIEAIVEDLLTVTNPNLGKDIKLIPDFKIFITDTLESLDHLKGANRIKISSDIKNTSSKFYTCPKSLHSIIQNLIENPIKYQDYKKAESFLNIKFDINEQKATFIFEDNGIGIPVESQSKIFDMFFRAHNIASGSGLGLYITKTVVERIKGSIQIESTEGVGSKFTVTIPNQLPENNI